MDCDESLAECRRSLPELEIVGCKWAAAVHFCF